MSTQPEIQQKIQKKNLKCKYSVKCSYSVLPSAHLLVDVNVREAFKLKRLQLFFGVAFTLKPFLRTEIQHMAMGAPSRLQLRTPSALLEST